ncbi:MAG: hypothetical protein AMXMBFR33_07210 [Candidatus Xenobia bacterium]
MRRLVLALLLLSQASAAPLEESGLELSRPIHVGTFMDVCGPRAALFGYEGRKLEAWVYPMKVLEDFQLHFSLEGYPSPVPSTELVKQITVRPEATILTYSHSAFTARHILFAARNEPGVAMLLEVDTLLPMTVTGEFRPRLKLMWPAGIQTGNLSFADGRYSLTEESGRFAAVIACPGSRDVTLMPYQEEPRDQPARFLVDLPVGAGPLPIVITGSVKGLKEARAANDRLLQGLTADYNANVAHYRRLLQDTVQVDTPDRELDQAYQWSKVGIDKGLVANPLLGTGLVAGFRTSGDSERPGYAWFFGRDALWTVLASTAYGDFATTRTALEFLRKFQRADGKVPHEISQSASLVDWWNAYPFGWASSDATPLYVIALADYYRASGDRAFLDKSWEAALKAWRFTAATDKDGDGLVENTGVGHAWVEGGALYPPDAELYLQGCWMEACRSLAELAEARGDRQLAAEARSRAETTRKAVEARYWLPSQGYYAFSIDRPHAARKAEPGPYLARRQARLNELASGGPVGEDTVLSAVPLWWGLLEDGRAQSTLDHLGSRAMATDWGHRILSNQSKLYDPLSYHYGSVWPLFTGWVSMAAYRYGRPHVGWQALQANVHLSTSGALGYVTELISGDFLAPFGRSSHHQVWSQAMVASPVVRGLLGLEVDRAGSHARFVPQPPADWEAFSVARVPVAGGTLQLSYRREGEARVIAWQHTAPRLDLTLGVVAPRDAVTEPAGRPFGDGQRVLVEVSAAPARGEVRIGVRGGAEVVVQHPPPALGAASQGLRVLRSVSGPTGLRLVVEGRPGQRYRLRLVGGAAGSATAGDVAAGPASDGLELRFGPESGRAELLVPVAR